MMQLAFGSEKRDLNRGDRLARVKCSIQINSFFMTRLAAERQ